MTTTVASAICCVDRSLNALCAAKYPPRCQIHCLSKNGEGLSPVGKISAIKTSALSSIPSGAFMTVASASGTRTCSRSANPSRFICALTFCPYVFRLSSIQPRSPKQQALGAPRRVSVPAIKALATTPHISGAHPNRRAHKRQGPSPRNGKRRNHLIPFLEPLHLRPHLLHRPCELMS